MTVPNEAAFIHRELGKIAATLAGLKEDFNEERLSAKESRTNTRAELVEMNERIGDLEKVSNRNSTLVANEVMPTVNKIKTWEQRGIGFLAFAGIAGTGIGATVVYYGERVMEFFFSK